MRDPNQQLLKAHNLQQLPIALFHVIYKQDKKTLFQSFHLILHFLENHVME